jgi:hypothetical protein
MAMGSLVFVVARVGVFCPGSWLIGVCFEPLLVAQSCSLSPVVAFNGTPSPAVVGAARYVGLFSSSWKGGKRIDPEADSEREEGAVL